MREEGIFTPEKIATAALSKAVAFPERRFFHVKEEGLYRLLSYDPLNPEDCKRKLRFSDE